MFRRHRVKPAAHDPLVRDSHGRVVGICTPPAPAPEENKESRLWRRRENLARTGELRMQAALRNQVAALYVDPGPSPRP